MSGLDQLAQVAAAVVTADPGELARAVHPALAPAAPHEALAVLIGQCPETPLDLWAPERLRSRLERSAWPPALPDLPAHTYVAGDGAGLVTLVVLARRPPDAALLQHTAALIAARFTQVRRLAHPPTLATAQAITTERRRVAETMEARLQDALEAVLAALRAAGEPEARAREAERVASAALVELRAAARAEAQVAERTAAAVFADLVAELRPMTARAGLDPEFTLEGAGEAGLAEPVAQAGAYLTRQAVENACVHAAARRVRVIWRLDPAELVIAVADDGAGFDPESADGPALRGMRGRAAALGGAVTFETAPGWGTRVHARLPAAAVESPSGAQRARELVARLGEREREVLALVADGARNREIAEALTLSPHTVKAHLANIMDKLEARSRVDAGRLWTLAGVEAEACVVPQTG